MGVCLVPWSNSRTRVPDGDIPGSTLSTHGYVCGIKQRLFLSAAPERERGRTGRDPLQWALSHVLQSPGDVQTHCAVSVVLTDITVLSTLNFT